MRAGEKPDQYICALLYTAYCSLEPFTMERYSAIVKYKTSFYRRLQITKSPFNLLHKNPIKLFNLET